MIGDENIEMSTRRGQNLDQIYEMQKLIWRQEMLWKISIVSENFLGSIPTHQIGNCSLGPAGVIATPAQL